ncbi:Chromodomain-helicase-DNA-binding protein 6 [Galdieria sulphuraria]|nr:Chromodomain-helicase-DNA-binding protein 6 [Galdieria sulphuraria]
MNSPRQSRTQVDLRDIGLSDDCDGSDSSSFERPPSNRVSGGKTKTSGTYDMSGRSLPSRDPWLKGNNKRESLGLRPEKTRTFGGLSDSDSLEDFSSEEEQDAEGSSGESEEEYILRPSRAVVSRKRKRSPPVYSKEPSKPRKAAGTSQKKANGKNNGVKSGNERKASGGKSQRFQSSSSWSSGKRGGSINNSVDEFLSSSESEYFEDEQTSSWYESEAGELSGPVMEKIVAMKIVRVPLKDTSNSVSTFSQRDSDMINTSPRKHSFPREDFGNYKEETQYLIKWKNRSYIHCDWVTEDFILSQPQGKGRLQRFRKNFEMNAWKRGDDDLRDDADPIPEEWSKWTTVDRILAEHLADDGVKEFLVKWCALPYSESTWETEDDIRDYSKIQEFYQRNKKPSLDLLRGSTKIRKPSNFDYTQVSFKNGGYLREYQMEGLKWLVSCWCKYQGSILADEMGLGKTLQTVAFLQYLYIRERIRGPFLIIAPLSTVEHWKREFESWTDMNVVVYHGNSESRSIIHQYEWGFSDNPKGPPYKFVAIVTTYESIILDPGKLRSIEWEVMVVDEAHRLKNRQAKLVEELRAFSTKHRILLTGTPIQNSSAEVWALLNFLEPSKFSDESSFLSKFAEISDSETAEKFREMLRPYMLRRQKEDVEKSIPPKEETIISVELTRTQKKWYRATLEQNFSFLEKGAKSSNVGNLHNIFMELRKCCNHPYLIKGVEIIETQHLRSTDDESLMQHLIEASGKLVLVDKLLPKLRESGHKVLIFSQMIRVLDILEDYLSWRRWGYERIDGRVRGIDRQQAIDRFCNPASDKFVFLLCTRAGGQGINLTAADTVIIFDSDWNPQNDIQAQARCHRIGQEKDVKVYRLVTRGTYEEDMFERASKKLGLDQAILQDMGFEEANKKKEKDSVADIKKEEIDRLLKKGAYAVLNDDDTAADAFTAEDIDQILQRRTRLLKVGGDQPHAPSAFSKASFASEAPEAGREELDLSDPQFWQKLMPSAAEKPILEALDDGQPRTRRQVQRYTMGEDASSEEQEEESSDDVGYSASGSGGRKRFNKGDRVRIQRALLAHGWGRWEVIRKHAGLQERRTLNDISRYVRTFVRLLTKYGAEYAGVSVGEVIRKFTASQEAFKPLEYVPEEPLGAEERNTFLESHNQNLDSFQTNENRSSHSVLEEVKTSEDCKVAAKSPEEILEEEFKNLEPVLADPEYQSYLQKIAWSNLERIQLIEDIRVLVEKGLLESNQTVPQLGTSGVHHVGSWWTSQFDRDLIRGTYKHGFGQYRAIKKDPELIFSRVIPLTIEEEESMDTDNMVCVPLPQFNYEKETRNESGDTATKVQVENVSTKAEKSAESISANEDENWNIDEEMELPYWPTVQVLNARVKKLVRAYYRMLKRLERQKQQEEEVERQRQLRMDRNFVKPGHVGTGERTRYLKCVPVWSKKEKADFAKLYFNIGAPPLSTPEISCWQLVRRRAGLTRKTPEVVEQYAKEFSTMCGQVLVQAGDDEGRILNCLDIPATELSGKFSPQELEDARMTLVSARKFKERRKLVFAIRDALVPKLADQPFINAIVQCLSESRHDLQPWWNTELDVALAKGVAKHAFDLRMIVEDPSLILKEVLSEVYIDEQQKKASEGDNSFALPRSVEEVTEEQRLSVVPKERSLITRLWFMVELASSAHPMDQEHLGNRHRSGARAVTVTVDKRTVELVRFSPGGPIGGVIPHGFSRAPLEKLTRKLLRDLKNRKKTSESSVLDITIGEWLTEKDEITATVKVQDLQPLHNPVEQHSTPVDTGLKVNDANSVIAMDISKTPVLSSPEGKSNSHYSSSRSVKEEKPRQSKLHTIPRSEDGSFVMPIRMGVLTIESLGYIEPYRKGFHNERAIYPIGFRSRRHFTSMADVEKQCDYICEIVDSGEDYPLFRVTCEDLPDHIFEETSASGCWCRILKVIRERTPEERRRSHVSVSGPEYFGFVNPLVLEMIQELPNADLCERYKKRIFLPPGTMKKQRTGVSLSSDHDSRDLSDSKDSTSPVS